MSIEDTNDIVHGQFVRIQTYARVASKKAQQHENAKAAAKGKAAKTVWNSADVIAEALRDVGACGHVLEPLPPVFHYGTEARMRGLVVELEGVANAIYERTGKRPRKDTSHLLAGVLSYPDDAPKGARYDEWRERSIKWLHKRYGSNLVAILEHQDEQNPHLHWYCIEPEGLDVKRLHEGWVAKKDGQDYRDAMRLVQDDYHRDVGAYVGLLRIGPGGKRLERDEYMAMKADAEQTRTMLHDIEAKNEANEAERIRVAQLAKDGQAEFDRLQRMGQNMATNMVAMAQRRAAEHASMLNQQSEQLTAYGAELAESAKRIEEASGHLVQIEVAKPPQMAPKRAVGIERPTAATTWTGDTPGLG
uniref:Plasmid recombination enzyme n=1 Tax=uncultured prokaryote TaxID=198431 RepID=A0A0H5Q262_9ZZZZ|nr:hypothetical protein [uncultured prokaryote]